MVRNDFCESVVIITGASSGIGKASALRLALQKANLVLAARDKDRLEAVAEQCRENGAKALAIPTDVSDEQQCQNLISQTVHAFGRIDMLINNAGFGVGARFEELPDLSLFRRIIDVNLMGSVNCTYHALPYLKQRKGRIVNVSSFIGKVPVPENTSYTASKFGMAGFSDSLRMELCHSGVSVTVIFPYWVITEFNERFLDKEGHPAGEAGRSIYTKKMITADEFAPLLIHAALKRRRDLTMWPGPLASWLKLIVPGLLDKIVMKLYQLSTDPMRHAGKA